MESVSKQSTPLELWLHEVQSYIYKCTHPLMSMAGFHFQRSTFTYKRKNKKSTDEISIIFLNKAPENYRISLIVEIGHAPVRQVKQDFMGGIFQKESNLCSLVLGLKDFPAAYGELQTKKDYVVYNHRDLFIAGDDLHQMLQYEIIPLCNQVSSMAHMEVFFEARPDWSLNTHGGGNICTDLIVSRLEGRRDFELRYNQLLQGVNQKIGQQQMNPESRQLLTLCYDALKNTR